MTKCVWAATSVPPMWRSPWVEVVPETRMRFPVRIARENPASGSHGVPLRHCVRLPATRTAYGGGKVST